MKNKKRNNKFYFKMGMVAILVAAIFGIIAIGVMRKKPAVQVVRGEQHDAPKMVRRGIDGVLVEEGKEAPPLAGVMVENMIEAQPLSGVAKASLVFEAVAEANITRFFGVYALPPSPPPAGVSSPIRGEEVKVGEGDVPEIGPVRSARPYFLDWAAEFNTIYMHVGGSPRAFELLRTGAIKGVHDVDQWYNARFYVVKSGRPRPHHLYLSTEKLLEAYEANIKHGALSMEQKVEPWFFKNDTPPDLRGDVTTIHVGYQAPYDVRWQYDKYLNEYTRVQWGGPHKDADGTPVIAKNIAVAFEDMKVLDAVGRKEFKTIGEGKGLVFQDGRVVVGTWHKASSQERMRFYDAQGNEVQFNAGVTWVEIVPSGYVVNY